MNDQSGTFPPSGAVPMRHEPGVPSTGLREVVVATAINKQHRINPSDVWRIILKWWWLIAGVVIAFLLAAIVLSLMITPEYRAQTTLEINRDAVQPVQMGDLQPMQSMFQDRDY